MTSCLVVFPQERQRLETILNLCAEYNKGESAGLEPAGPGRAGFPGGLADGLGRRPSMESVLGGTPCPATLRLLQRQRESDEENLKEECSSTESTHQEVRSSPGPCTAAPLHNGDRQVRGHGSDATCMPLWGAARAPRRARLDPLSERLTLSPSCSLSSDRHHGSDTTLNTTSPSVRSDNRLLQAAKNKRIHNNDSSHHPVSLFCETNEKEIKHLL